MSVRLLTGWSPPPPCRPSRRRPGSWLRRNTRPYLSYVRVLATPVVVSVQVAVGAGEEARQTDGVDEGASTKRCRHSAIRLGVLPFTWG